jgi:hypothetical protein
MVNEDLGLSKVCGIRKYVLDINVEGLRPSKPRTMQQQSNQNAAVVVVITGTKALE